MAMSAPSRANSRAVPRPMPRPPPVTSAVLSSSLPTALSVRRRTGGLADDVLAGVGQHGHHVVADLGESARGLHPRHGATDLAEGTDGLGERDVDALEAGELLGHVEGLGEELLDLPRPADDDLVVLGELVHAEDRDDVLQVLVPLENGLDLSGHAIVLLAHD